MAVATKVTSSQTAPYIVVCVTTTEAYGGDLTCLVCSTTMGHLTFESNTLIDA